MASLFKACRSAVMYNQGGTFNIGGYDIELELYHQSDIDDEIAFGDDDESKIVVIAGDTITVPPNYILTPNKPKKSLVIFCNTLVNDGSISMYQKAPNVLPHDYYIIQGSVIGSNKNVIVPAYANNGKVIEELNDLVSAIASERNGQSGSNRNCGAGGFGASMWGTALNVTNGSGYAFGGGAGSGGINLGGKTQEISDISVSLEYPMRGGSYYNASYGYYFVTGGVGNPSGASQASAATYSTYVATNSGCGGRVIIFCNSFENNGTINANGSSIIFSSNMPAPNNNTCNDALGGASGGGAVDVFYTNLVSEGTITAQGGAGGYAVTNNIKYYGGAGGDGSITLTQWNLDKIIKEERKMFTINNWTYLFSEYTTRLREDVI